MRDTVGNSIQQGTTGWDHKARDEHLMGVGRSLAQTDLAILGIGLSSGAGFVGVGVGTWR